MMLPSSGGLQSLTISLVVILFTTCAQGFFPTVWKEATFGNNGVSHIQQTEQAFQTLATKYFPKITSLSKSMLKARDTITKANADVDKDQDHFALHCDGESFDEAQARLRDLQGQVCDFLAKNNPTEARKALGSALHTVQDFYAHSNWVEMGNSAISDVLGRALTIPHAGPLEHTCVGCAPHNPIDTADSHCLDCRDNELGFTSLLTSGYRFGEDVSAGGIPEFKCHHGGYTDNPRGATLDFFFSADPLGGINKDSLNCGWSPHAYAHPQAVSFAIDATIQYIDDIKQKLTDSQLRQLFGVGPTLAFVIDTAGNMADIIQSVTALSIAIVDERLGTPDEPSSYVISPFSDQSTGPVTMTSDYNAFKAVMQTLSASGGGGCPELSVTGILNAINVLDEGSVLFLFTDATAKDAPLVGDVISGARAKSISMYIFKFNSSCDDGFAAKRVDSASNRVYSAIALATSGEYHSLPRSEVATISGIIDSLTSVDNSFILKVVDNLKTSFNTYIAPVDSYMTQLTFSLRGAGIAMTITQPSGSRLDVDAAIDVTSVVLTDGIFVTVHHPTSGYWSVCISGTGNFSLDVTGISVIHLASFTFAALAGRPGHTGYFPLDGLPPYNTDIAAIGSISGPFLTATFDCRAPGSTIVKTLAMESGTGAFGDPPKDSFFALLRLTPGNIFVYVSGFDSGGKPYQRCLPSIITPVYSDATFSIDNGTSNSGTNLTASTDSVSSTKVVSTPYGNGTSTTFYLPYQTGSGFSATSAASASSGSSTSPTSSEVCSDSPFSNTSTSVASTSSASSGISSRRSLSNSSSSVISATLTLPVSSGASSHVPLSNSSALATLTSSVSSGISRNGAFSNNLTSAISTTSSSTLESPASSSSQVPYRGASSPGPSASGNSTSAGSSSNQSDDYAYTVTEIIYTVTSFCPTTVSTSISGVPSYTVTDSISVITLTSTIIVPCHKCLEPSRLITLRPTTTISYPNWYSPNSTETSEVTMTEFIYITTSICFVTVSTNIISGLTSYHITESTSTVTLTATSTPPCEKCSPRQATITVMLLRSFPSDSLGYGSSVTAIYSYSATPIAPVRTYGAPPFSGLDYTTPPDDKTGSPSTATSPLVAASPVAPLGGSRGSESEPPRHSHNFRPASPAAPSYGHGGSVSELPGHPGTLPPLSSAVPPSGSGGRESEPPHHSDSFRPASPAAPSYGPWGSVSELPGHPDTLLPVSTAALLGGSRGGESGPPHLSDSFRPASPAAPFYGPGGSISELLGHSDTLLPASTAAPLGGSGGGESGPLYLSDSFQPASPAVPSYGGGGSASELLGHPDTLLPTSTAAPLGGSGGGGRSPPYHLTNNFQPTSPAAPSYGHEGSASELPGHSDTLFAASTAVPPGGFGGGESGLPYHSDNFQPALPAAPTYGLGGGASELSGHPDALPPASTAAPPGGSGGGGSDPPHLSDSFQPASPAVPSYGGGGSASELLGHPDALLPVSTAAPPGVSGGIESRPPHHSNSSRPAWPAALSYGPGGSVSEFREHPDTLLPASTAAPPGISGGSESRPPHHSDSFRPASPAAPSFGPGGRVSDTLLPASPAAPTLGASSSYGGGNGGSLSIATGDRSTRITSTSAYHGPLYTGGVGKGLKVFGQSAGLSLVFALFASIIMI